MRAPSVPLSFNDRPIEAETVPFSPPAYRIELDAIETSLPRSRTYKLHTAREPSHFPQLLHLNSNKRAIRRLIVSLEGYTRCP